MAVLFPKPPIYELPLSLGGDLYCIFVYKPLVVDGNGDPILSGGKRQYAEADYPDGASVTLTIDAATPIVLTATIEGSQATVQSDKATVTPELVPANKLWRATITYAGGLDIVMCNGLTVRADGRVPK